MTSGRRTAREGASRGFDGVSRERGTEGNEGGCCVNVLFIGKGLDRGTHMCMLVNGSMSKILGTYRCNDHTS